MNTNLYTKELKRSRKSLITWSAIVVGFTIMVLSIYPSMQAMGEDLTNLMGNVPDELKKAMGMDEQTWSSILGFYSTYFGIYIVVLASIYTASTGATILSKEEKDRTAEFLLTRPISRLTIFKTKIADLVTLSGIIISLQAFAAVISILIFGNGDVDWNIVLTMQIHGAVLILFFTSVGVLLSSLLKPQTNFMGIVFGIVFGTYFLNALSKAADSISWLGYISPYNYIGFEVSDPDYGLNYLGISIILFISALLVVFSYKKYEKRDITA